MTFVTCYNEVKTQTLLALTLIGKELASCNCGSPHGGHLDSGCDRCIVHGVPHYYMVAEVPAYQRLSVDVALVSARPWVAHQLWVMVF